MDCPVPKHLQGDISDWQFGQPTEPGDYEWWCERHSIDIEKLTLYAGYNGNPQTWGRDVWYRRHVPGRPAAHRLSPAEFLNNVFEADPNAIHALIDNRVPCNRALADHPHVIVDMLPMRHGEELFQLGMLGVINGLLTNLGLPKVWAIWDCTDDDDGRRTLVGFREQEVVRLDSVAG